MSIFTDPGIVLETIKLPKTRNFVREILFNGCARPWYVYVETFIPAFLKLVITLLLFDIDDIVRFYGVTRSRSRLTGRRKHGPGGIIKASETWDFKSQKVTRQGLRIIIKLTAPLEAIGFIFLLIAATDEFFQDWQSLIERAPFCTNPQGLGPLSRTALPAVLSSRDFGQSYGYDTLEQNRGNWGTNAFSFAPVSGPLFCSCTLKGTAGVAGMESAGIRIRVSINGIPFDAEGGRITAEAGQDVEMVAISRVFIPIGTAVSVTWGLIGANQLACFDMTDGDMVAWIENNQMNL